MSGTDKQKGITPRTFHYIFDKISNDKEARYNVYVSFIQIYLETIQDLLNPETKDIRIREDPDTGVFIDGAEWIKVQSPSDCESIFIYGEKNRVTQSTKMNMFSSRSHAIFMFKLEKSMKWLEERDIKENIMTRSTLYLVDLAGSERVKKTGSENLRLEETKKINFSLLVLGNCIQSLTDRKGTYISYRDSKLTRLLQDSLGGNSKTMLIVTISPSTFNMEETISSLNFASRAMKIQNKPIINKTIDFMKLANKLQNELDKLNDQYTQLKMNYDTILNENRRIKNGEIYIELQRKSLLNSIGTTRRNSMNNICSPHNNAINSIDVINNSTYEFEIKKLDAYYDTTLKAKVKEYQDILLEVDKIMLDKENEIDQLRNENNSLKNKVQTLTETNSELQKQNEDLIKRLSELTYKLEQADNEGNNNNNGVSNNHGKTIEQLENTISQLEKSNANLLNINREVVATYIQNTSTKLKSLFEKKKDLKKELSQVILNTSKNDIMIKINNEEKDLIDNGGELINSNNTNMSNHNGNSNSLSQRNQAISKLNLEKQELYKLNEHNFKLKHSLSSQIDLIDKEIDKYQNMYSHYSNIYEDTNNNIISHNNTNCSNSNNSISNVNGLHTQNLLLEKDKTYYACECIKHQIEIEYLNKKLTAISSITSSNINTNQHIQYKVKCNESSFTLNCEETNCIYTNNNKAKIEDLKSQVHKLETIVSNIQNELNDKNDYINEISDEKEKFLEENKLLLSKQSITDNICTQLSRHFTDYNINLDKIETYININNSSSLMVSSKTVDDMNSLLHTLNPKQYQQIIFKQTPTTNINSSLNNIVSSYSKLIYKIYTLFESYICLLTQIDKTNNSNKNIKNNQITSLHSLLSTLSKYDTELLQTIQLKIYSLLPSTPLENVIKLSNEIYSDIVNAYLKLIKQEKEDMLKLNDNCEQMIVSSEEANQVKKYQTQIKIKEENIDMLKEKIAEYDNEIYGLKTKVSDYENKIRLLNVDFQNQAYNFEMSTKLNFIFGYIFLLFVFTLLIYISS